MRAELWPWCVTHVLPNEVDFQVHKPIRKSQETHWHNKNVTGPQVNLSTCTYTVNLDILVASAARPYKLITIGKLPVSALWICKWNISIYYLSLIMRMQSPKITKKFRVAHTCEIFQAMWAELWLNWRVTHGHTRALLKSVEFQAHRPNRMVPRGNQVTRWHKKFGRFSGELVYMHVHCPKANAYSPCRTLASKTLDSWWPARNICQSLQDK